MTGRLQKRNIRRLCSELPAYKKIMVAIRSTFTGGIIAVLGATVGGLLIGPAGIPLGKSSDSDTAEAARFDLL